MWVTRGNFKTTVKGSGHYHEMQWNVEKAGYAGRVFHSLRRSSARDRIRAGVHERVVMSVNGWKTRAVFDRYSITSSRDAQEALEKTEAYRKSQLQST
jgi:hypothetical protein